MLNVNNNFKNELINVITRLFKSLIEIYIFFNKKTLNGLTKWQLGLIRVIGRVLKGYISFVGPKTKPIRA